MRSRIIATSVATAVALCACSVSAQSLSVLPVKGVYGLSPSSCEPGDGLVTAQVAEVFCEQVGEAERLRLGAHFAARVRAAFPNVVDDLSGQIQAGESAEGRLSKTVIATLHVSRVDLWQVEKPAAVDTYVPLTLSLFLTNALSGEVLFVENHSTVIHGTLSRETFLSQARAQLPAQLTAAVDALVMKASARFKPFGVTGTVRSRVGDRFVFDVGRKGGIREGDTIGADAQVVFADAHYSIIEPLLGTLREGQTLSRQLVQPIEVLERPIALVVVADLPTGVSRGYVTAVFEDAVGQFGGLAVTPVNPSFSAIRNLALGEARVSLSAKGSRALPEYFVRVSVAALDPLDVPTNIEGTRRRVFEGRAFIEVLDRNGRIVFATQGVDRIAEDVTGGIAFALEQRRDTVIKNALTRAAQSLGKDFRPAQLRLEAKASGDQVAVVDPGGALGLGATAVVLRKAGGTAGGEPVWIPLGKIQVTSVDSSGALARSMEIDLIKVRPGDQVAFESGGGLMESRMRFSPCLNAQGKVDVSRRGTAEQPLYGAIAVNSFASGFRGPVYLPGFPGELKALISDFSGADELGALREQPSDVCFSPVHQVSAQGEKMVGEFVQPQFAVALGFVLKKGEQRLAGSGLQSVLSGTGLPADSNSESRARALQLDLAVEASKLTLQAAKTLKPPQSN